MPARSHRVQTAQEQRIAQLESDLAMARWAIIQLMPFETQRVLIRVLDAKTRMELLHVSERTAEQLVDLCENPTQRTWHGEPLGAPRSPCPLCGGGTASAYDEGYALPSGLMRHLLGSHNSRQCTVFEAATALGLDGLERGRWRSNAMG